jgi:hypothetical protein
MQPMVIGAVVIGVLLVMVLVWMFRNNMNSDKAMDKEPQNTHRPPGQQSEPYSATQTPVGSDYEDEEDLVPSTGTTPAPASHRYVGAAYDAMAAYGGQGATTTTHYHSEPEKVEVVNFTKTHPLPVQVKQSALDTDTHKLVERPRRIDWQSGPLNTSTGLGYDSTTGEFLLPVNLRNVVGFEMRKASGGQPGHWFPGGTFRVLLFQTDARVGTTGGLVMAGAATYANGTDGVGATLTADANGTLKPVDGVTLTAGDKVLVMHEADDAHNGLYEVTSTGSGASQAVLTRVTSMDESDEFIGSVIDITEGDTLAGTTQAITNTGTSVTVGTTDITFDTFNGALHGATITMEPKYYTSTTLAAALQSAINAFDSAMTVSYDATTEKLTFSTATQGFNVVFEDANLSYALGFAAVANTELQALTLADGAYSGSSTGVVDLTPGLYLYVTSEDLKPHYGNTDVVETLHIVDGHNLNGHVTKPVRRFAKPVDHMRTVRLKALTRQHDGTYVPYDTQGRTFGFTFYAYVQQMEEIQRSTLYG